MTVNGGSFAVNGSVTTVSGSLNVAGSTRMGNGPTTLQGAPTGGGLVLSTAAQKSMAAPHVAVFTANSSYPTFQQLNWSADNVSQNYDSYSDGSAWRASGGVAPMQCYKINNKWSVNYGPANPAAGASFGFASGLCVDGTTGNVGIGTRTPAAKLDVAGNRLRISNSGGEARVQFDNGTGNTWLVGYKTGTSTDLTLSARTSGGSETDVRTLKPDGSVVLSTGAPVTATATGAVTMGPFQFTSAGMFVAATGV
jgi:hypothetical protein